MLGLLTTLWDPEGWRISTFQTLPPSAHTHLVSYAQTSSTHSYSVLGSCRRVLPSLICYSLGGFTFLGLSSWTPTVLYDASAPLHAASVLEFLVWPSASSPGRLPVPALSCALWPQPTPSCVAVMLITPVRWGFPTRWPSVADGTWCKLGPSGAPLPCAVETSQCWVPTTDCSALGNQH